MANLIISSVCNQRCAYCFAADHAGRAQEETDGGPSSGFLSRQGFEERLAFLQRSQIDEVRLLGGEPTLHPQFVEFVSRACAVAKEVTVFSNGLMPVRALDCLCDLALERCTVVVNVNEPRTKADRGAYAHRIETMRQLGRRAIPGFTIYRTDFSPDFLLEVVRDTGCTPNIRLSMAQPCLSGTNEHIHPNQYRAVAQRIVSLASRAAWSGITLDFDCGFVRCMFSRRDLDELDEAGARMAWHCSPILDIDLEGRVIPCFPLSRLVSHEMTGETDATTLRQAFEVETHPYRQVGVFAECSTCLFKARGECSGGCLATAIRRFRPAPSFLYGRQPREVAA